MENRHKFRCDIHDYNNSLVLDFFVNHGYCNMEKKEDIEGSQKFEKILEEKFKMQKESDFEKNTYDHTNRSWFRVNRSVNIVCILDFLFGTEGKEFKLEKSKHESGLESYLNKHIVICIGKTDLTQEERDRVFPILKSFLDEKYKQLINESLATPFKDNISENYGNDLRKHPFYQLLSYVAEEYSEKGNYLKAGARKPMPELDGITKKYIGAIPKCYYVGKDSYVNLDTLALMQSRNKNKIEFRHYYENVNIQRDDNASMIDFIDGRHEGYSDRPTNHEGLEAFSIVLSHQFNMKEGHDFGRVLDRGYPKKSYCLIKGVVNSVRALNYLLSNESKDAFDFLQVNIYTTKKLQTDLNTLIVKCIGDKNLEKEELDKISSILQNFLDNQYNLLNEKLSEMVENFKLKNEGVKLSEAQLKGLTLIGQVKDRVFTSSKNILLKHPLYQALSLLEGHPLLTYTPRFYCEYGLGEMLKKVLNEFVHAVPDCYLNKVEKSWGKDTIDVYEIKKHLREKNDEYEITRACGNF